MSASESNKSVIIPCALNKEMKRSPEALTDMKVCSKQLALKKKTQSTTANVGFTDSHQNFTNYGWETSSNNIITTKETNILTMLGWNMTKNKKSKMIHVATCARNSISNLLIPGSLLNMKSLAQLSDLVGLFTQVIYIISFARLKQLVTVARHRQTIHITKMIIINRFIHVLIIFSSFKMVEKSTNQW